MSYTERHRTDNQALRRDAIEFEEGWEALCRERGETRYIELMDRYRRCYARLLLPSEVMFVWNRTEWIPANDSDQYGAWEPVVSLVTNV